MGFSQPKTNPQLNQVAMNGLQFMPNVTPQTIGTPNVANSGQLIQASNQMEGMLPKNLQITPNNPLFAPNAGQQAQQQYYNQAILPQLGSAAEQQYLGGNLGTSGSSTFGANYLGNMAASGAQQSFFAGQDYLNNEISNLLNERQSYFGNDVNLNQNQSNLAAQMGMQANEFNAGNNLQAQEYNAGFPLQQSQLAMGYQNQLYNQGLNYDKAQAQNMANIFTGGLSGLFGLGSLFSGMGSGGGGSTGSLSTSLPLNADGTPFMGAGDISF